MTTLYHLAVVSTVDPARLVADELARVSAALQKQVLRDFAPVWGVQATIDPFPSLEAIPIGYWPVVVVETAPQSGVHKDRAGTPTAWVEHGASWSLAASHEILEMLADPHGDRMIAGDAPTASGERVEFLVEVCDPCQGADCGYLVNGELVADFYTPAYFEPLTSRGGRYSFGGNLLGPRDVRPGGYLSWRDPTSGDWTRWANDGDGPYATDLGPIDSDALGFRAVVDARSGGKRRLSHTPGEHPLLVAARQKAARGLAAARRRADLMREAIASRAADRS